MSSPNSDLAFTSAVKKQQSAHGSRAAYARLEQRGGFAQVITPELAAFIAERDSVYLATASADGQPYIQHRGGPKGFLRVLDDHTLAFVDYLGNRQYVSTGNLSENDRAFLFLMDYQNQQRIKIWGRAKIVEGDAELESRLMPPGYKAKPEHVILFQVEAWDANCPRHIPELVPAAAVAELVAKYEARIVALEAVIKSRSEDNARRE